MKCTNTYKFQFYETMKRNPLDAAAMQPDAHQENVDISAKGREFIDFKISELTKTYEVVRHNWLETYKACSGASAKVLSDDSLYEEVNKITLVSTFYEMLGDLDKSLDVLLEFESELQKCRLSSSGRPYMLIWNLQLSITHLLYKLDRIDDSILYMHKCLDACLIFDKYNRMPEISNWGMVVSHVYTELAKLYCIQGDEEKANKYVELADKAIGTDLPISLTLDLLKQTDIKENIVFAGHLGTMYKRMNLRHMHEDYAHWRYEHYEEIVKQVPDDDGIKWLFVQAITDLIEVCVDSKEYEKGENVLEVHTSICEKMLTKYPQSRNWKEQLCKAWHIAGILYDAWGKQSNQFNCSLKVYQLKQELYGDSPSSDEAADLSLWAITLGHECKSAQNKEQALNYYLESVEWNKYVTEKDMFYSEVLLKAQEWAQEMAD